MREPKRPAEIRHKVFRGSDVVKAGVLSKSDLRTRNWHSLFRDVYADGLTELTHRLRCNGASAYLLPVGAAIAGRSAAYLFGVTFLDGEAAVEVLSPRRFGPVAGLRIRYASLGEDELITVGKMLVTSPLRTCLDIARWHPLAEAVTYIDAMAGKRLINVQELIDYAEVRVGERGWAQLVKAARLADPGAESPPESRLRVGFAVAGLPRFAVQHVIRDEHGFIARADLALAELKIAVEYDGRWHHDPSQFDRDRQRLSRMSAAGWLVIVVTAERMRKDFDGVVADVRKAIRTRSKIAQYPG